MCTHTSSSHHAGVSAQLLGILGAQSAANPRLTASVADDASHRLTGEEPTSNVEGNMPACGAPGDEASIDAVPKLEPSAAAERLEFPPDVAILKHLGVGLRHFCFERRGCSHPGELHRSNAARLPSVSKGARSRSCAGSVRACQTFSGEWRRSLTRMSAHFSPSFRTCAPLAGTRCVLLGFISVSLSFSSLGSSFPWVYPHDPGGPGGVREHPRGPTEPAELGEPGIHFPKRFRLQPVEAALSVHRGFDETGVTQHSQVF